MKTRIDWILLFLISGIIIAGCSPRTKYEHRLKHELARGVRYDSLFLGLYFGMPEKEFYLHCWKLNHKGMLRQGSSNTTAEYKLKDELKYPAQMDFYPKFSDGKIFEMPVSFSYEGWSPWNKKLSSDNLQKEILRWYEKVYGKGFIQVEHLLHGIAYVKIDGNRRITIFKQDDLHVWAVFTDMLVKKNWNIPSSDSDNNPGTVTTDSIK
jgi:hypothetical protein